MKTFSAKASEVERKWYIVDAKDRSLGRVAVTVVNLLRGKGKPIFTPHVDTGDFVVVINVEKIAFSDPNKWEEKRYTWYTGYPGLRVETAAKR